MMEPLGDQTFVMQFIVLMSMWGSFDYNMIANAMGSQLIRYKQIFK